MDSNPVKQQGLDVSEAEDGLVVVTPEGDDVHHLNAAASVIFELCDGAASVERIAAVVQALFPPGSVAVADVADCIDQFRAKGLVC
jgi:hypothetical protein